MILTTIQKAQEKNNAPRALCVDLFFEAALQISDVLLEHSLAVFNMLPTKNAKLSVDQLKFYNALPKGLPFTRIQAIKMAQEFLSVSAIDKFLRKMTEAGLIFKGKHGLYLKE